MRTAVIALLACSTAGCTAGFDCLADSECRDGEICNAGTCRPGNRNAQGQGDSGGPTAGDSNTGQVIDTTPPVVAILNPAPYELLSGILVIEVGVIDDVAVDPENVTAVIKDSFEVPLLPVSGASRFVASFDTALLGEAAFPSLVVTAYDLARNKGETGLEFALDTRAPYLSFVSPDQQFYRVGPDSGSVECSVVIQPLGEKAVTHGSIIDRNYEFGLSFFPRLRIEDRGNGLFPGVPIPIAGTDPSTTRLYLLDKTGIAAGQKLLIDDGSGGCKINPAVIPNPDAPRPDQAIVQTMVPAGPSGAPWFDVSPVNPPCEIAGLPDEGAVPFAVCGSLEPRQTLWTGYATRLDTASDAAGSFAPAIWVLNEYEEENILMCSGGVFDAANFSDDGEVCLAASATDFLGFTGVSLPIAICTDRTNSGACIGFDATVNAASMCSDGCAAASNLNRPPDFGTTQEMKYWPSATGGADPTE